MGNELFKTVTTATGLPEELIGKELSTVLSSKGIAREDVTIDELREVLASYLREVLSQAKDHFEDGVWVEEEVSHDELGQE